MAHSSYGTDAVTVVASTEAHGSPPILLFTCHATESTPDQPTWRDSAGRVASGLPGQAVTTLGASGTLGVTAGRPSGPGRASQGKCPWDGLAFK